MGRRGPSEPYAICQRTGQRFPVREIVKEKRTGLFVHYSVVDPEHPQENPRVVARPEEPRRTFINPDVNVATSAALYWADGTPWQDPYGPIWSWAE